MFENLPFRTAAVGTLLGAVDGLAANHDINKNGGVAPALTKSLALKVQALTFGAGILGELAGAPLDLVQAAIDVPLALGAREVVMYYGQKNQTHPAAVQGFRALVPAGYSEGSGMPMSAAAAIAPPPGLESRIQLP